MCRCLAGSRIFKTRSQGKVWARDSNLGIINIKIIFKARSLDEIFKRVSVHRENRRFKDWSCFKVKGNEKICSKKTKKERPIWQKENQERVLPWKISEKVVFWKRTNMCQVWWGLKKDNWFNNVRVIGDLDKSSLGGWWGQKLNRFMRKWKKRNERWWPW